MAQEHFLNSIFKQHFNGGVNGNRNILVSHTNIDIDNISDCSVSDCETVREVKTYNAIYIHYTGEEDNGMDSHEIQAVDYESAWKLANSYPGRLYKLTEKS